MKKHLLRHGFTLIELSLALVIIGLLIGSVTVGKSLLRSSQVQGITTAETGYVAAINQFKEKYGALPGDMPNATNYWGKANSDPAACTTTIGQGTATCDGNGDNHIALCNENWRMWQHLVNAQLIQGSFTGVPGAANCYTSTVGINIPGSTKLGGYTLWYQGYYNDANFFPSAYGHMILFGSNAPAQTSGGPALNPSEARSIDVKIDDGNPTTGTVMAMKSSSPAWGVANCTTADDSTALYSQSTKTICDLIFKTGF